MATPGVLSSGWTWTSEPKTFLQMAEALFKQDPVQCSVPLHVATSMLKSSGKTNPIFGVFAEDNGKVTGVFMWTRQVPISLLHPIPRHALKTAMEYIASFPPPLPARLVLPYELVDEFLASWPGEASLYENQRLYKLGTLKKPNPSPPGFARSPTPDDIPFVVQMNEHFAEDIGESYSEEEKKHHKEGMADRLKRDPNFIWVVKEGEKEKVVAWGAYRSPLHGSSRVGPIFTVREERGKGYGSAITVAVTEAALRAGATSVCLFTQLSNPVSNAVYKKLGTR